MMKLPASTLLSGAPSSSSSSSSEALLLEREQRRRRDVEGEVAALQQALALLVASQARGGSGAAP